MKYKPEDAFPKGEGKKKSPKKKGRPSPSKLAQTSRRHNSKYDNSSYDPRKDSPFVPGVVHVVLKEGLDGRRIAEQLQGGDDSGNDSRSYYGDDYKGYGPKLSAFRRILEQHRPISIEPTFDATPPGLEKEENPPAGRERFLTIHFSTKENTKLISKKLRDTNVVEQAVPVPRLSPPAGPLDDPLAVPLASGESAQWYIQRCGIDDAWQLKGTGLFFSGQGVVVADLDWGFRMTHQDLVGRVASTYNSMTGGTYVGTGTSYPHGVAVLGLLSAAANGVGMSGVAFGADLWAIQADKTTTSGSTPTFINWVFAIDYVRRTNSTGRRKIICLEVQTIDQCNVESDPVVHQAIRDAIAAGVVVCVPAGNGDRDAGRNSSNAPFAPTGSILVGATSFNTNVATNRRQPRSNWGPSVVVSAPGDPNNDLTCGTSTTQAYRNFGYTSGAVPKVAGTVALMLEANPALTHAEIRDILVNTGTAITDPGTKPIGRFLNATGAIAEAQRRAVIINAVAV
jgi:hypothetical protein